MPFDSEHQNAFMSNIAVELEGATKTFGTQRAVNSLDLAIPAGSIYGFIGPNGSGKTTTIRLILWIFFPDQGRVKILGKDMGQCADDRVAYLSEERGLYRKMKVRDLLQYYASCEGRHRRSCGMAGSNGNSGSLGSLPGPRGDCRVSQRRLSESGFVSVCRART